MRSALALALGLVAAGADALVTRAAIDACLVSSGVPIDIPGSDDYIRDIAPFNIRLPYIPTAIARPSTTAHIQKSVQCANKLNVKVSAKSGGHSYASFGFGGENGHLVIELDRMINVTAYNAKTGVAHVQPGARLGHLATVLYEKYDRAISHGTCPGVGISGHFAHGGFGFSSHMHGLAVDSVVGATVVLADGRIVEASATENADLFWGLKGAGSNFGIVATWKLVTFPAPKLLTRFGITLNWNKTTAVKGIEAVEDYARWVAPREVNFRIGDYGKGNPGIEGLFYGTPEQWRAAFQPLLNTLPAGYVVQTPTTLNWIQSVLSYSNFDHIDFITPQPQENFYAKSLTLKTIKGKAVQNFVDYYFDVANKVVDRFWFYQLDVHGGANSQVWKVTNAETAYPHRDKLWLIQFYDRYENNETYPDTSFKFLDGWVDSVTKVTPKSDWGMYINYADPRMDRDTATKNYYGVNLPKLQKLKAKFDPTDRLYYPQAVRPVK
ncbi:carbohydrate oxidase from Microdochium Nivale in complex with substrate analogue [Microdochium trichocladiopsis]|uniref:Carbohydrate oxidase from Microdochium Nivale in complex with substrate analogue n=1 Tax=Microdochium trichocladiopsis TaxID=1682393 RepID=A0A9P8YD21_9PEZI|nr:carbohydrate oxidase from Microdochium Nivale in complex with substrate analogue [Microdochium trichocladiopsis]KAH7036022.1 carbohydrate oxidase from Microdochium Nivale in complex with substrate analogue [Microdochium trichocladiopsis]